MQYTVLRPDRLICELRAVNNGKLIASVNEYIQMQYFYCFRQDRRRNRNNN